MKAILIGSAMAVTAAVGLAAPANADPQSFFAAVQAAGVIGVGPAILSNGYNVCWEMWHGGYTGDGAAAALRTTYPTLTTEQAARFVNAAYANLCPVNGAYDWWAYGTGG